MAGSYLTDEERAKIGNAEGAELTLVLYTHAVRIAALGRDAFASGDTEEGKGCCDHLIKVIDLLLTSLDMNYSTAKDFERMYNYMKGRLTDAGNAESKTAGDILAETTDHFTSIKENWEKVMKAA